jgi:Phosphotransferase enzyme family
MPGWFRCRWPFARAAAAFGLDAGSLRALGGNSGSAWGAGDRVLRVGRPAVIDAELAASSAAAAVVPVPAVLDRADAGDASAVLLAMLPGQPMAQFARRRPELARAAGQACGTVHALLAGVPAPAGLRAVPGPDRGTPAGRPRVLHLDLHPLNILAGASGEVTGVLDWANAAAGDPDLDRARTWTILTLDPAARARRGERRHGEDTLPGGSRRTETDVLRGIHSPSGSITGHAKSAIRSRGWLRGRLHTVISAGSRQRIHSRRYGRQRGLQCGCWRSARRMVLSLLAAGCARPQPYRASAERAGPAPPVHLMRPGG